LRGSLTTGFRAPTLYDLNGPVQDSITSTQYDDPLLCPGGVAKPGANPNISCHMNLPTRAGGNPELKPERARSYSLGVVLEPSPRLTMSLDYAKIKVDDLVGAVLYEEIIMGDFDKYRDRFHYNAAGTALDYINVSSLGNAGERMTQVFDLTAQWRQPVSGWGQFDAWFNGTWVWKDTYETLDGDFPDNLNVYNGTVRWRHNAAVRWSDGPWSATLSQRYSGGYADQNTVAEQFRGRVKANSIWTLAASYTGIPKVTLAAGVKNLLNTDPPFSNQTPNTQTGYDPRYSDPIGRALYLRASYKF
jgi:iron complex outermembrane receptor protein